MTKRNHITLEKLRNSACAKRNPHLFQKPQKKPAGTGGRIVAKHFTKRASKEKDWMGWNLLYWCNEKAVTLEEEYRFMEDRRFRFDWAIPSLKIAIEYEGLFSEKSGHTTPKGYTKDADKYNSAQQLGWIVLRFTPLNYKNLLAELNKNL